MTDFVRVKLENGSEASISKERAERLGLTPLDKNATDSRGTALAEKPHLDLPKSKYAGLSAEELQDEVDQRQLSVEGTGANGNVLKGDLVAALVAHDATL